MEPFVGSFLVVPFLFEGLLAGFHPLKDRPEKVMDDSESNQAK